MLGRYSPVAFLNISKRFNCFVICLGGHVMLDVKMDFFEGIEHGYLHDYKCYEHGG